MSTVYPPVSHGLFHGELLSLALGRTRLLFGTCAVAGLSLQQRAYGLATWIGSDYAAEVFGVPLLVATAIVTLTAEGLMRWLLIAVNALGSPPLA